MQLSTLYGRNADGSIKQWSIDVEPRGVFAHIKTQFGRVDGALTNTLEVVTEGKALGTKSATTPMEQAQKEARSRWMKKKKAGYVESIEAAREGQVDAVIEGGIVPMLAQKYSEHAAKIQFPCLVQPKLDGIRCLAIVKNGKCTLWTRTRKPILSVPHIQRAIESQALLAGASEVVLDGELYHHGLRREFEKIVSLVRQDSPKRGHEVVEYHIYDMVSPRPFMDRLSWLESHLRPARPLVLVETRPCPSEAGIEAQLEQRLKQGFEGVIVRNARSPYESKRSFHLQKVKRFEDADFEITGTEEGRGLMAGRAVFVCKTASGGEFRCKMEGPMEALRQYLGNPKVVGKKLTIRYQGFTSGDLPRFPIGVAVRDYE